MATESERKVHRAMFTAIDKMADTFPNDWYPKVLAILGVKWEERTGRTTLAIKGVDVTETEIVHSMEELSVINPDWMVRVVRLALLVELGHRGGK